MAERYLPGLRFRRLTRFYDPFIRFAMPERRFRQRLLEQATPQPGQRILDLGCGTGTLAILVKAAQSEAEVIGLDADQAMLAQARTKADAVGAAVQFDQGLSTELPHGDESVDLILSTLFFHHLNGADKRLTAAEIARVLRPGGMLHVVDWGRPADPLMRVLFTSVRLFDGFEQTRDNRAGALPRIFEQGGLEGAIETEHLRTAFGTLSLYRAQKP